VWLCAVSAYAVCVYAVCVCYSACDVELSTMPVTDFRSLSVLFQGDKSGAAPRVNPAKARAAKGGALAVLYIDRFPVLVSPLYYKPSVNVNTTTRFPRCVTVPLRGISCRACCDHGRSIFYFDRCISNYRGRHTHNLTTITTVYTLRRARNQARR